MKPISLKMKRYWYTNILIRIVALLGCIPVVKYTACNGKEVKITRLTLDQLSKLELKIDEITPSKPIL